MARMAVVSIAETVTRPASATLRSWFPVPSGSGDARGGALLAEEVDVAARIAETVSRMATEEDPARLDVLTDEATVLFARAQELRLALALAARAEDDTWLVRLDLD